MPSLLKSGVVFDQPRVLPVFVLADVSGSMAQDNKIGILNAALKDMIETFQAPDTRGAIKVGVITFGGATAVLHQDKFKNAVDFDLSQWKDLTADGATPLGKAFEVVRELIEDNKVTTGSDYRPVIALVTDGYPTDDWQTPLNALNASARASKADRFALAIGAEAAIDSLQAFVEPAKGIGLGKVFSSNEVRTIASYFQYITMSTRKRSQSKDKNETPQMDDPQDLKNLG